MSLALSKSEANWIAQHQGKHFCKCGCGQAIKIIRQHRYERGIPKFVGPEHRKRYCIERWLQKHRRKHICGCGCGRSIEVRSYMKASGHIPKFIKGHIKRPDVRKPEIEHWLKENLEKHMCQCGCGQAVRILAQYRHKGIPRFVKGHSRGGPLDLWVKQEQGRHFCICGCKGAIKIQRDFRRHGIPCFIIGHNSGKDHPNARRVDAWIKNQKVILCACGCKEPIPILRRHYHVGLPRYLHKHGMKGENNPNWKGGISEIYDQLRNSAGMRKWKRLIKKRDRFRCQMPGCLNPNSSKLHAHHVIGFTKDPNAKFEIWNGITLCSICHYSVKGREEAYEAFFFEILEIKKSG